MCESYNKMGDNLNIVERQEERLRLPNLNRYGLVRQIGPWQPTNSDLQEIFAPAKRYANGNYPRDFSVIAPDAVANGVDPNALHSLFSLAGGFSLFNGTVVDPPIYDARVTAPGKRLGRKQPLRDISDIPGLAVKLAPGMFSSGPPKLETKPLPLPTPTPDAPKPPTDQKPTPVPPKGQQPNQPISKLSQDEWRYVKDIEDKIKSTRMTPFGPLYSPEETISIYNQLTFQEKRIVKEALTKWKTMTPDQKFMEWDNKNSIFRKVYTLFTGQQAAYYTLDFIEKISPLIIIGLMLGAPIYSQALALGYIL